MIKERFMVQGKRIADDVMIIGWLVITGHNEVTDSRGRYLRTDYCYQIEPVDYNEHRAVVYPETIGPVAAMVELCGSPNKRKCPNCGVEFVYTKNNYCYECGQRLNWGGVKF